MPSRNSFLNAILKQVYAPSTYHAEMLWMAIAVQLVKYAEEFEVEIAVKNVKVATEDEVDVKVMFFKKYAEICLKLFD